MTEPRHLADFDQTLTARQRQLDVLVDTWHQLAADGQTLPRLAVGYSVWLHDNVPAEDLADLLTCSIHRIVGTPA